jgi:putative nucleotidyltransferase with HDIG domain
MAFIVGDRPLIADFTTMIVPAALAGLLYYAINHGLLAVVRSLTEPRRLLAIWQEHYRWLWPHYVAMGVLGLTLAAGHLALGWAGLLAMALPVAMTHLAFKQYLDSARENLSHLQAMNERLSSSYQATLDVLTRALDTRDAETEEHSRRVQQYAELIARHYGVPEEAIEHISRGALLHDIGKIGVPDAILLKPERLNNEEQAIMRRHPSIGAAMIAHIPFLSRAAEVVQYHHEAFNGTGYPAGLQGQEIPLGARIFAVADALDAMTSDRPYRRARPLSEAMVELQRCQGHQFDPRIVDILLTIPTEELIACASRSHGAQPALPAADAPVIVPLATSQR